MDDEKIIELYWQRKESAIRETGTKYGGYLRAVSVNILQNREDAEECVNDTYWSAWNAIPPHRPHILRVFLGAIARNLSLDRYRRKYAQKRAASEFSLLLSELKDCIPAGDTTEKQFEDHEIAELITLFLKWQPQEKRRIFIRRYWYCDSIKMIAKASRCTESKIKSSLFETRKKLRRHLETEGITL